jgi:hypothetical protein
MHKVDEKQQSHYLDLYVTMKIKVPQNQPKAISMGRTLKKKQIDTKIAEIG